MITLDQLYKIFLQSTGVTIDSRKIKGGELFFAFSGNHYNAAVSATSAMESGAIAVIVEDEKYADEAHGIYYCPSTLKLLQELSKHHRLQLKIPIIALTGSNGKTTTKELMNAVLSQKFCVQYTFGNLNNHIGVPLTLLSIRDEHEIAIVEMGANHQNEISLLCDMVQPDFGYITNFGKAHLEGFGGYEGVIKGKSELYRYLMQNGKTIIVNAEDMIQVEKTQGYTPIITFGNASFHTVDFDFEEIMHDHMVGVRCQNSAFWSQLTGAYNFNNICAAIALGLYLGVDKEKIRYSIADYTPNNMRSQVESRGEYKIIVDTYNANPSSMEVSLQNFSKFGGYKIAILGDMLELGEESNSYHQSIFTLAQSLGIDEIYTVGAHFQAVNTTEKSFDTVSSLAAYLADHPLPEGNVLLKGSRGVALERVLIAL